MVPEPTLIADVNGMFAPAAGCVPGRWMYSKAGPEPPHPAKSKVRAPADIRAAVRRADRLNKAIEELLRKMNRKLACSAAREFGTRAVGYHVSESLVATGGEHERVWIARLSCAELRELLGHAVEERMVLNLYVHAHC